jgi:glc operon protein GlcG
MGNTVASLFVQSRSLGQDLARCAVDAAVAESRRLGCVACIAVVDAAGHLAQFLRMDGAPLLSVQLAQDKAYTAAIRGLATHEWWEMIKDDPSLVHGINKIDRLIIFGGGLPIIFRGDLIGAVAASGMSTSQQDRDIAQAAVDSVLYALSQFEDGDSHS